MAFIERALATGHPDPDTDTDSPTDSPGADQ